MKICGIYRIQSKVKPERCYIGSAKNINKRWWNHLYFLRKNEHHSLILQRHFNKYGEADLQFSILLGCEKHDLISIEQYFIDTYNPYFNINRVAGRSGGMTGKQHTEATKLKQSKAHKGCKAWNRGTKGLMVSWNKGTTHLFSSQNKLPITQHDKQGNFIKEWGSACEVEREISISRSNIGSCIKGRRKTAGGYIWKYKNAS